MDKLIIGRIYVWNGKLYRIFRDGGAGFYSGRGCTKMTATPYNHIRFENVEEASLEQINIFLELEMANGMAQTVNKR